MKPVKIAILSCNHGHARGYYKLRYDPLFDLVGVSVAPDAEALETLAPDVPRYGSDQELYEAHPDLEAVVIASDNQSHHRQVLEAAARGLHIYSMKVPTFSPSEYQEMIAAVEKAGVVNEVELEIRFHAPVYRAKEIIESGELGQLLSVNLVNYSHNPVWWRPWQCNPEKSYGERVPLRSGDDRFRGGALADHPHVFDLVQFLVGDTFDRIFAEISPPIRPGVETEDVVRIIGKMKNGVSFSIDPSYANDEHHVPTQTNWEKYPQCVEVFMTAVGTKGVLTADLYSKHYYSQRGKDSEYMCNLTADMQGYSARMLQFYNSIRHGQKPMVDLRSHYSAIMAMVASYDSIAAGKILPVNNECNI